MKRYLIPTVFSAAVLVTAQPLLAESEQDYLSYYFGFALGIPSSDEDCDYYGYNCDGSDTSFKIYGGKRFHENIAIEVSFQDLGKLRDEKGPLTTTAESEGINLSIVGIIPTGNVGYLYGKAGYMLHETDYNRIQGGISETSDDDGTDFTYGIGYAFTFGGKYDFRIEYERLNDLNDDFVAGGSSITAISFGGTIYFD